MKDFSSTINEIYSHFQDDYGRNMYANRLLFSLTGDGQYIRNVIAMTDEGESFSRIFSSDSRKVIFGCGFWGKEIVKIFSGCNIVCFIDNKPKMKECCGLPVVNFDEFLLKYNECQIIITTRLYHAEIYHQLINNGIKAENIVDCGDILNSMMKKQYFDLPELKDCIKENEVFIDAGAFDGQTACCFYKWAQQCKGRKEIICFEPDSSNAEKCKKTVKEILRGGDICIVKNMGLWDKTDTLCFSSSSSALSKIDDVGDVKVSVVSIDEELSGKEITFIKMDIEGSERKAILGASDCIRRYKPKLAISIYHKPEDIWELPELILNLNPEYKFYMGHYSIAQDDTVLYAI